MKIKRKKNNNFPKKITTFITLKYIFFIMIKYILNEKKTNFKYIININNIKLIIKYLYKYNKKNTKKGNRIK